MGAKKFSFRLHLISKRVSDLTHHTPNSVNDRLDLAGVVLVVNALATTKSQSHVAPIVKAHLDLRPTVAHRQVSKKDSNLSSVLLKADVNVHNTVRESLYVALQAEVEEKDISDLVVALVLI